MLLKFLEGKYMLSKSLEDCSSLVQEALTEVGLKNVAVRKEVAPSLFAGAVQPGMGGEEF